MERLVTITDSKWINAKHYYAQGERKRCGALRLCRTKSMLITCQWSSDYKYNNEH